MQYFLWLKSTVIYRHATNDGVGSNVGNFNTKCFNHGTFFHSLDVGYFIRFMPDAHLFFICHEFNKNKGLEKLYSHYFSKYFKPKRFSFLIYMIKIITPTDLYHSICITYSVI